MQIIPAASGAKALAVFPGASMATLVDVVAWELHDMAGVPARPIVATAATRVAVKINEGPQCFEWPETLHPNTDAFVRSAKT